MAWVFGVPGMGLAIAACNQTSPPATPVSQPAGPGLSPSDRNAVDPDGVVRRGRALSDAPSLSIEEVFDRADQLARTSVKVAGAADAVCKAQGCWFSLLAEDGRSIRVMAKDHKFFVPSKVQGLFATVEGHLDVKAPPNEETSDNKGRQELTISAVGLEMITPPGG